jgi:hypothetical protein
VSTPYTIGPNGPTTGSAGTAIFQPGRPHDPVLLVNTGAATIYLNSDQQPVLVTDGFPLNPAAQVTWDEDLPLFAACATSSTLTVGDSSGIGFDPSTIAAAILAGSGGLTLAQQIAAAIKISGAPPIDNIQGLDDSGNQTNNYVSPNIATAGYQSVSFYFDNTPGTPTTNCTVTIQWFSISGAPVGIDTFAAGLGTNTQVTMPVRGAIMIIQIFTTGNFRIYSYGSYKAVDHFSYLGAGLPGSISGGTLTGNGQAGVQTWFGTVPIGTAWTWQPDVQSGRNHLTTRITVATTGPGASFNGIYRSANAYDGGISVYAADVTPTATFTSSMYEHEIILPPRPFEIVITAGTAAIPFRYTLVSERPY